MNQVDLHCHTTASDGLLTPTQLVALAARRGLRVIAITDHDSTEGLDDALAAAGADASGVNSPVSARDWDIEVIPGVEINTDVPEGEVHVLGYFVDWHDADFQVLLTRLREGRFDRARRMVAKLDALGVSIPMDRVLELAGDAAVGRPHVAQTMVEAGYVTSVNEAFERYIGRHGPAYAERLRLTPVEAAAHICAAGGLPVLAHPVLSISQGSDGLNSPLTSSLLAQLSELCDAGLVGLEVYYPGYTAVITDALLDVARRFNLVPTGGSDYHGPGRLDGELGGVYVPMSCVRRLKALIGAL